jgi:hypothetical protein
MGGCQRKTDCYRSHPLQPESDCGSLRDLTLTPHDLFLVFGVRGKRAYLEVLHADRSFPSVWIERRGLNIISMRRIQ